MQYRSFSMADGLGERQPTTMQPGDRVMLRAPHGSTSCWHAPSVATTRAAAVVWVAVILLLLNMQATAASGLWISPEELPDPSGSVWDRMKATADGPLGTAKIASFNSNHDVKTLAVALVYARTGVASYRQKAADAIKSAIGTEDGGEAVMLGRNLVSYVIAADLIDLAAGFPTQDEEFRAWLAAVRHESFKDGTLITNDEKRANNHGRVAGASRVAIAVYLDDVVDLPRTAQVFKGWLGDRSSYSAFKYGGDLSWQEDPINPVGIDPFLAVKQGYAIDGALPEEMRRGCSFRFPPVSPNTRGERSKAPWSRRRSSPVRATTSGTGRSRRSCGPFSSSTTSTGNTGDGGLRATTAGSHGW